MKMTLEEALKKIDELEEEIKGLKEEIEDLKTHVGGRRKHDDAWMASYNDFAIKYESGKKLMEIVAEGNISRRTAYRYKAYYDELRRK